MGARCLDGSPPGYYFRVGTGAGKNMWHIYLPGGAWCGSAAECVARSKTRLGSSTFYPDDPNSKVIRPPFMGILSSNSSTNPAFYNWNLVRPIYCDGGGFAGTTGRVEVGGGKVLYLDGWKIVRAILDGEWCGCGERWSTVMAGDLQGRPGGWRWGVGKCCTWMGGRSFGLFWMVSGVVVVKGGLLYCDGGGFAGTTGRVEVGGGKVLYLDGWKIVRAILDDLKSYRGLKSAAQILLSGSSAGGQAVVALCDRIAAAFPWAATKCISDSGFFIDSKDRTGGFTWRILAKSVVDLHQPKWSCLDGPDSLYLRTLPCASRCAAPA
ncbi:unnamed protein product [Closterium sp. Yama58-4]|nr:unnamed protein product [Closterium sp. Yama58-4]